MGLYPCGSHYRLTKDCKGLLASTGAGWRPTTMTKPRAGRASKFTPETIQKIKEMVAQGLSREEIAQRLDVTVGSLQVTCSKLGVSLRRPRMRYPSYERLPELKLSR